MLPFSHPARAWFDASFDAPTPVQTDGWERIAAGEHALLIAPTGSGKTLAAFLWCIDRLANREEDGSHAAGVRVLYVSPLKALVYDIERNLRAPLIGVERAGERLGTPLHMPRVAVRTGDTPQRERRAQARDPAEILVTTPESLYLILGSAQRETLASVETVIIDEIHALAPTKRGAHLALSLERVAEIASGEPQRIGLSATARPLDEVARFLGGDRPVAVVDSSTPPRLDLEICVPVPDMTKPSEGLAPRAPELEPEPPVPSLWPALHPQLLEQIRGHRSTILFVNSRGLCERLSQRLNELAGEDLVRAHHGSLAHEQRRQIEEQLKTGALRGIVATSSLELGIDMGAVDLVLMVESPGAVGRGLQRVGRAGHGVGEVSRGRLYPKHRGDLLEAAVVCHGMERGEVEPLRIPRNPLDVLAQQIVAMASNRSWGVDELFDRVRRAAPFRALSRETLAGVLDMLAGRYPSTDFAELRPRLVWDRDADRVEGRRGSAKLALLSGGTIPDRGQYAVHLGPDGPRIGELDEEMVYESRAGQTLTLGASTWRVAEITRDRVVVTPAPGEVGRLPFWRGEGPGRPVELGRALGAFVRDVAGRPDSEAEDLLRKEYRLDRWAARNLIAHLAEQREATGTLPSDRAITVERFRDELGDWRVCILSPFGARIHAPWALALEARLGDRAGFEVQALCSDDGIVLRFADAESAPGAELLIPEPEELEDLLLEQLGRSALFASQFRENAARALLLPRRRPGSRTPLWVQRLRSQNLLAVARDFPAFPIMLETYRSCLQDVFDVPGLVELLGDIRSRRVRVDEVETRSASPFARSLVFAYTAVYLYQGDTPVAERRAQALTLDRNMLRDLLGQEELRELLDAGVIETVEAELQGRAEGHRAEHEDGLTDLLRRVGDLDLEELRERCTEDPAAWLASLDRARRVVSLRIGGELRWIAAEDASTYRDALGAVPPAGLPTALLDPVDDALEQLLVRFARTRGPFETAAAARRYGLLPAQLEAALRGLEARDRLLHGAFQPQGRNPEWCHPEVLRRVRRRTLAGLRGEVAPVDGRVLARFLPAWHGVGADARGDRALDRALEQLEGMPLSFADLEQRVLPERVADFDPRMLDERGALGQWVWVGCGALGERDGRIALFRRERVALLLDPPEPTEFEPLARALLDHLDARGASFFGELRQAAGGASERDILDALWDLAWAGCVSNDTFAPLRALASRHRRRRPRDPVPAAGRWFPTHQLRTDEPTPTERAHARALTLLERYGVLSRDALAAERFDGGFAALYPVLRAMEEMGKLRRGHFVEGMGSAQFAFAGAVDRLRAARSVGDRPQAQLLAACDPANPFGALLPWPDTAGDGRPRRAAGAAVLLLDGAPALFLERGQTRALTFPDGANLEVALNAVRTVFRDRRRRSLRLERIDGVPALASKLRTRFEAAGFRADYKGLVLERFGG